MSFNISTSNQYIVGSINWSESNVNTANNTSDVYAEMRLWRTNTGYTSYGTDNFWIKINGVYAANGTVSYSLSYNSNTYIVGGSVVNIPHNSDGTKTVTIEWGGGGGSGGVFTVNYGSGNAGLTTIARASTVASFPEWTAGTQNLPISLSVHDASYHHTLDMYVLEISGSTWDHVGTRTNIGSSTTWVFTDTEIKQIYTTNNQYEYRGARLYVTTYDSGNNVVGTYDYTTGKVDAVPTGTTTLGTNGSFNIGTSIAYSINNFVTALPSTGTFYYDITLAGGGFSKTWSNITAQSGTLTLTNAEMNSLYAATPNSNTLSMTCTTRTKYDTIYTEDGNPTSHDTSATAKVTNSNPAFGTGYTYQDTKTATKNLTSNNQYIIQNQSTVEVDLPSSAIATGVNGATITSYLATLGSTTVNRSVPSAAPSAGVSANAGSSVAATTHYIKYTWVDANGESLPSPERAYTVPATGNNLVITLPSRPTGVTTTKVYVSTTSGGETLQGSTTGTSYTLSAPPTTNGATVPTTMPFIMGTLNASSNATLSMQAVDSRGNSKTTTKTVNVVPYSVPVVTTTATRGSGFNSTVTLTLSGTISPLNVGGTNKNSLNTTNTTYAYGQTGSSLGAATTFAGLTTTLPNYSATDVTLTMDNTASWNVRVIVTDQLSATTINMVVQKGVPLMFVDATKESVGVGKFPDYNNSFEPAGTVHTSALTNSGGGAINMHNGDIIGANAIYWNDTATGSEGLNFLKTGATVGSTTGSDYDTVRALDGDLFLNSHYMCPTGMINMYAAGTAPTGWLLCQGQAVSRTTYAKLYNVIGTTYGAGDGSTTFNLPNLMSQVPVGYNSGDSNFNALGKTGGEATHTLSTNEMPSHNHGGSANYVNDAGQGVAMSVQSGSSYGLGYNASYATSNTGGGAAHNNLQPYITLNFIIKI